VGVINDKQVLVTLKTDPDPGTVDLVPLHDGRVTGAAPTAVSAPQGTLTPFGFAVYGDGTAVITLAHSSQDGLFRRSTIREEPEDSLSDCYGPHVRVHAAGLCSGCLEKS
jgi:hypothetical protein